MSIEKFVKFEKKKEKLLNSRKLKGKVFKFERKAEKNLE